MHAGNKRAIERDRRSQRIGEQSASIQRWMKTTRDQVGCKCTFELNNNNKCIAGGISGEFMCWLSFVFWMQFFLSFVFCTLPCNEKRCFMITTILTTKQYDLYFGMAMQSAHNLHHYLTTALHMTTWAFATLCSSFNADQKQLLRCICRRCCNSNKRDLACVCKGIDSLTNRCRNRSHSHSFAQIVSRIS